MDFLERNGLSPDLDSWPPCVDEVLFQAEVLFTKHDKENVEVDRDDPPVVYYSTSLRYLKSYLKGEVTDMPLETMVFKQNDEPTDSLGRPSRRRRHPTNANVTNRPMTLTCGGSEVGIVIPFQKKEEGRPPTSSPVPVPVPPPSPFPPAPTDGPIDVNAIEIDAIVEDFPIGERGDAHALMARLNRLENDLNETLGRKRETKSSFYIKIAKRVGLGLLVGFIVAIGIYFIIRTVLYFKHPNAPSILP